MRQRNLITFGVDDVMAQRLTERAERFGCLVRKTREAAACLNLLRQGAAAIVLLRVGRDLESEFTLLADIGRQFPQIATIVIGEVDHAPLANLAWDLGARCVLVGQEGMEQLGDVVVKMLQA